MGHIADGTLRRLVDDPLAVSDDDVAHLAFCQRCRAHRAQVAGDAAAAAALVMRPQPVPDVDRAWDRLRGTANRPHGHLRGGVRPVVSTGNRWRALPVPHRPAAAAAALVIVAAASAVVITTALSHGTQSPPASEPNAIETLASVVGLNGSQTLGGFDQPSGSVALPFGVLSWSSAGTRHAVASVAAARQASGLGVSLPAAVPQGVGSPDVFVVQPEVTAKVVLSGAAGGLAGSSLLATAGPAVLVEYGSASSALGLPTLAVFEMARPRLSALGSSVSAVESFVLSRHDLPASAGEYLRLLSDPGALSTVPLPQGAAMTRVQIDGSPGLLVTDPSVGASGVVWTSGEGTVDAAIGLLDSHDILDVADQLG